jgi:hypothetical protein
LAQVQHYVDGAEQAKLARNAMARARARAWVKTIIFLVIVVFGG